jgi:hypothetical protein
VYLGEYSHDKTIKQWLLAPIQPPMLNIEVLFLGRLADDCLLAFTTRDLAFATRVLASATRRSHLLLAFAMTAR